MLEVFRLGFSVAQLTFLIVLSDLPPKLLCSDLSKSVLLYNSLMARSFDSIAVASCFSIVPSGGRNDLFDLVLLFGFTLSSLWNADSVPNGFWLLDYFSESLSSENFWLSEMELESLLSLSNCALKMGGSVTSFLFGVKVAPR